MKITAPDRTDKTLSKDWGRPKKGKTATRTESQRIVFKADIRAIIANLFFRHAPDKLKLKNKKCQEMIKTISPFTLSGLFKKYSKISEAEPSIVSSCILVSSLKT